MKRLTGVAVALLALGGAGAPGAEAVSLSEAYLFSAFSSPTPPDTPSFTFTGTGATGFRLILDGNGVVTGVQPTGDVTRSVTTALTYQSHSGTINSGETGGTSAAHVNAEIGTLDDIGAVADGSPDAVLNLDFGNDARVKFNVPAGLTHLLIGEDAGWDRFRLQYCPTENCPTATDWAGATTLIDWTSVSSTAVTSILAASTDFQTDDSAPEIDQAWLFVFDAPLSGGFLRLTETVNGSPLPGSEGVRLEIDFMGGGALASSPVPEPATLGLLGTGLAVFGFWPVRTRWRRGRSTGPAGGPRPRAARGA